MARQPFYVLLSGATQTILALRKGPIEGEDCQTMSALGRGLSAHAQGHILPLSAKGTESNHVYSSLFSQGALGAEPLALAIVSLMGIVQRSTTNILEYTLVV